MKKFILFVLSVFILSGCIWGQTERNNYVFKGEGEYWEAEINYHSEETQGQNLDGSENYDSQNEYEFTLIYKGDTEDIKNISSIQYSYDLGLFVEESTLHFNEPLENKRFNSNAMNNGPSLQESAEINVQVIWDGEEDNFILKSNTYQ